MDDSSVISISLPKGIRTPGERLQGTVDLDINLIKEKKVESVSLALRGELKVWWSLHNGNGVYNVTREKYPIFQEQTFTLWQKGNAFPSARDGIARIPFDCIIPNGDFPPSIETGSPDTGAKVHYSLRAIGSRTGWFKQNIKVHYVFPFLPFDISASPSYSLSPVPSYSLSRGRYDWKSYAVAENVRKGLLGSSGQIRAELILPDIPQIPLFRIIPIRLRIRSRSKQLPHSMANNPTAFDFPRNPKLSEMQLMFKRFATVSTSTGAKRTVEDDLGLQAGFGTPTDYAQGQNWGKDVEVSTVPPFWTLDESDPQFGYWNEEINFSSTIVFRCPPPIQRQYLTTTYQLELTVDLPGLGNKVTLSVSPLVFTSGILPRQEINPGLTVPNNRRAPSPRSRSPSPMPHISSEIDLPPSYYQVPPYEEEQPLNSNEKGSGDYRNLTTQ
ncbi:hypothetical protein M422DRAFT_778016 [Sphaerobolus stellatus SS14]|uniref:Arrestin-like N-terminal domain-containing protein n=1 Tax=Sphaerobolus stellatus (strain SS14) TaxID=990650 RepID=A0A0C9VVX9_SPHS4|nr:hypothetical protein M422DRAFT_778016 [Sphaerobolus stellatus SS14]